MRDWVEILRMRRTVQLLEQGRNRKLEALRLQDWGQPVLAVLKQRRIRAWKPKVKPLSQTEVNRSLELSRSRGGSGTWN